MIRKFTHNLLIGEASAERIKKNIGIARKPEKSSGKKIEVRGNFADGKNGQIIMPRVRVIAATKLKLFSEARSIAGEKNTNINY